MSVHQTRSAAKPNRHSVKYRLLPDGTTRTITGQQARVLRCLVSAGNSGVTALEVSSWALRMSEYIRKLRSYGLAIEMKREEHEAPVSGGWHGRYFLRSDVEVLDTENSAVAA